MHPDQQQPEDEEPDEEPTTAALILDAATAATQVPSTPPMTRQGSMFWTWAAQRGKGGDGLSRNGVNTRRGLWGVLSSFRMDRDSTRALHGDEDGGNTKSSPITPKSKGFEERASYLSLFFVAWMFPILRRAKSNQLTSADLGELNPRDEPALLVSTLESYWETELRNHEADPKANHISLFRCIRKLVTVQRVLFGLVLAVTQAAINMTVPIMSSLLIQNAAGQAHDLTPAEIGLLTFGVAFVPWVGSFCQTHILILSRRAAVHMYASLTMLIFKKSMRSAKVSPGKAAVMMATDAGTSLERSIQMVFPLIVAVPQIAVILWLLYDLLGVSVFAGLGSIVLIFPINVWIFRRMMTIYKKIMKHTERRLRLINEFIVSIRIVKSFAWEQPVMDSISVPRTLELGQIWRHALFSNIGLNMVFMQVPNILQIVVIWTYYALGGSFAPWLIFPAIQYFAQIGTPMTQLPNAITQSSQTLVAIRRIQTFLLEKDLDQFIRTIEPATTTTSSSNDAVLTIQGTFKYASEDATIAPALSNLKLDFLQGELVAVVGTVGCGKTSLLLAILGELIPLDENSKVTQRGNLSYAAQEPFILSDTLRNNILFGAEMDEERYWDVVQACSLTSDLKLLQGGDAIVIGENGINLSGGQRARVALARALYARTNIVLLDDPLSAVDAHVGEALFATLRARESNLIKNRTIILVTTQVSRLAAVDKVIIMKNGAVDAYGSFEVLRDGGFDFSRYDVSEVKKEDKEEEEKNGTKSQSTTTAADSQRATRIKEAQGTSTTQIRAGAKDLFQEEVISKDTMAKAIFIKYISAAGAALTISTIILSIGYLIMPSIAVIFLSYLTTSVSESSTCRPTAADPFPTCHVTSSNIDLLYIYSGCMAVSFVLCAVGGYMLALVRVNGGRVIHQRLLTVLSRAKVAFYDVTPVGRITNRFTKDVGQIDGQLTNMMMWSMTTGGMVLGNVISTTVATAGVFIAFLVPLGYALSKVFSYQRSAMIDLTRLEGRTRAPLYSQFTEVLAGRVTIRAFSQQDRFESTFMRTLRGNVHPFFLTRGGLMGWLQCWLNSVGFVATCSTSFFVVYSGIIGTGSIGLALSSVSAITVTFYFFLFVTGEFEMQLQSVQRVSTFCDIAAEENEAAPILPGDEALVRRPWPSQGEIVIEKLVVGYRQGPDVLHGISFTVNPHESVGICGRTGSGKSSFFLSLLRIIEPRSGRILIDGVDTTQVGLHALRSSFALVTQQPTLFTGTLRYNLSPFGFNTDAEMWDALEQTQLKEFVSQLPGGLDFQVSEQGENLSVGERQLLSIARALLRKARILLLDEASASLDMESDKVLQASLALSSSSRITIAHRIDTIASCHRVLVLGDGHVVEYDSPKNLLNKTEGGLFKSMVDVLDEKTRARVYEVAGGNGNGGLGGSGNGEGNGT